MVRVSVWQCATTMVFVPYYRDVATQLQRGVLLEEILLYWGGDERGCDYQNQRQDFPPCVPIATQSCHAVGIAYAMKYRGEDRAVVTTCGEGATSKGDFYESINVAGAMNLPVVSSSIITSGQSLFRANNKLQRLPLPKKVLLRY